jgi:Cytochrome P450
VRSFASKIYLHTRVKACYFRRVHDWKCMVSRLHSILTPTPMMHRAILNDPCTYPEPNVFKPERFLNPDGSPREDPILASGFGFGRRACPGRHFVDATMFITVASLFSVFNIQKGHGADGEPFAYRDSFTGSILWYDIFFCLAARQTAYRICTSRPNPFPCSIVPRDKCAEQLIRADSMAG